MTEHPYWTVLTIATGLVTLSVLFFVVLLCAWAWTKLAAAREQRTWARNTRIDWDAEHEALIAEGP